MKNHYHLVVLHVDRERAEEWSDEEVGRSWGYRRNAKPLRKVVPLIVVSQLYDEYSFAFYLINHPMFIIDATRPESGKRML